MLIPQTIPDKAKLVITLEYGEGDDKVTKTLEGLLKTDDIPLWEPGIEYVYTISTTSVNWTYVFEVIGSYQEPKQFIAATHEYKYGAFVDDPEKIEIDASVTEGSYYKVKSYRYRTNNPRKYEYLSWTAEATEGTNTVPEQFSEYKENIPMTVNREEWLLGSNWKYSGVGSNELIEYSNLEFEPQYVATDWKGDWEMRAKGEKYGSESAPVDLSLVNGSLNTANCYVVNAGGWYSIPLYYGSSMKNGIDIFTTYNNIDYTVTYTDKAGFTFSWEPLVEYLDYQGQHIKSGKIETPVKDAILVWQDAYGIIDICRYDENNKRIVFHVDPTYLQQANCVLAIRDKDNNVIWSWHIWVTEHWVNENNLQLGVGDVECKAYDPEKGPFSFAPYNLGWCDPKNVLYLKRSGKITFYQKDKEDQTIATKTLDIIQRSDEIEFWIGNSTYYQFGRKDPIVGFINNDSQEKYHYGEMPYTVIDDGTLSDCILKPNAFFMTNQGLAKYYNLWNNYNSNNVTEPGTIDTPVPKDPNSPAIGENLSTTIISNNPNLSTDFAYSAIKTIYDPSPAGYVVPPCDFFKIFGIGNPNSGDLAQFVGPNFFKGDSIPFSNYPNYFNYVVYPYKNPNVKNTVTFNVNGQRRYWYMNMNPCLVYLWSNTNGFYEDSWQGPCAFGFALGYDTKGDFTLNSYFQGSKFIARPVRCIKEPITTQSQ